MSIPPSDAESDPFWEGAADGRLLIPVCDDCGHWIWYPRSFCPVCGHGSVTWTRHEGTGTIYACTVVRTTFSPVWAAAVPYVVAYVELTDGPRIQTNIETDDPAAVKVGAHVRATFVPLPVEGEAPPRSIVRFQLGD